jgi:AraC-like DNA-binding protein
MMAEALWIRRSPSPVLAPFVESLIYVDGVLPFSRERVLPSGTGQLLFNLDADRLETFADNGIDRKDSTSGAALSGVRSSHTVIDAGGRCALLIVSFHVGGSFPFFGAPASATSGQLVGLESMWERDGATLRERLLEAPTPGVKLDIVEAELCAHLVRPIARDPGLTYGIRALSEGARVSAVSEELGLTSKRFVRYFSDRVGLTPKRFARVSRLQRTLSSIQGASAFDWSELAVQCGYFDQAHLIHEFRELAGITPSQYRPRTLDDRNHLAL